MSLTAPTAAWRRARVRTRPPVPDEPSLLGLWAAGLSQQAQTETFQDSLQGLYVLPLQYSQNLTPDDQLLICGWMGNTFMWSLLAELDHSDQALPAGSRVMLSNDHNWTPELLESRCKEYGIRNLCVCHVRGDPCSRSEMQKLIDVTQFKGAFVVCDSLWASDDAGQPSADGGLRLLSQAEMLSLDAAMLMVAVNPRFLYAYLTLGMESDVTVQDASAFAGEGKELSFAQLQARAASVRQILMGGYCIPASVSQQLEMVVNPQGLEERLQPRVWNTGDHRCKLVTMAKKKEIRASRERGGLSSGFGSVDASDGSGDANGDVRQAAPARGLGGQLA
ncbi:hypothetical protein ABPG75_003244 [Micractinium tetrahymenae]